MIQGIEKTNPNAQMAAMTQNARVDLEWEVRDKGWQMARYLEWQEETVTALRFNRIQKQIAVSTISIMLLSTVLCSM